MAHAMGLLDERQAVEARSMQAHVQDLIAAGERTLHCAVLR